MGPLTIKTGTTYLPIVICPGKIKVCEVYSHVDCVAISSKDSTEESDSDRDHEYIGPSRAVILEKHLK